MYDERKLGKLNILSRFSLRYYNNYNYNSFDRETSHRYRYPKYRFNRSRAPNTEQNGRVLLLPRTLYCLVN